MEVGLICPRCGAPTTFYKAPVFACPRCQEPYPQTIRESAEASFAIQRTERPLLLTIAAYATPGIGGLMLLGLFLSLTGSSGPAIDGETVSRFEYLQYVGARQAILGVLLCAIGVGLHLQQSWTRWLMVFYWIIALAAQAAAGWTDEGIPGIVLAVAGNLLPMVLAYWYLFIKENVVAYYDGLERYERAVEARLPG